MQHFTHTAVLAAGALLLVAVNGCSLDTDSQRREDANSAMVVAMGRSEAAHNVAIERCKSQAGDARARCQDEADDELNRAKDRANADKLAATLQN